MFIRRTTIKSRWTGENCYTYRLVQSVREGNKVRQRTLLNLGRQFDIERHHWSALTGRIDDIVTGQADLMGLELEPAIEAEAQRLAALLIHSRREPETINQGPDYYNVDVNALELVRPRSAGGEHLALSALEEPGFESLLREFGFNGPQRAAAMGTKVARMLIPASELATHEWLQQRSALGELIDYDYGKLAFSSDIG